MKSDILPITAVVATRNRPHALRSTLASLEKQSAQPSEIIVVDASTTSETADVCATAAATLFGSLRHVVAAGPGAAPQRNQGVALAQHDYILFHDDDIDFRPECIARLWGALQADPERGGVNAMIENQRYHPPGFWSRCLFRFLHGRHELSYAGLMIGPAFNLLPEDREDAPAVQPVEWLNTTCTLYRRAALPTPPFPPLFQGASIFEDAALSLVVARNWKLANARTARIFHDHLGGDHKRDAAALAEMTLVNREYVMAELLGRRSPSMYAKLAVAQLFTAAANLRTLWGWRQFPAVLRGQARGWWKVWRKRRGDVARQNRKLSFAERPVETGS